ncbi:MAG TPA: lysophospholipid acyltransferase family protein [bacterium]
MDVRVRHAGISLTAGLCGCLPHRTAMGMAERTGDAFWRCSDRDRRVVSGNLGVIGGLAVDGWAPAVREVFRNFGRYLVEFFSFHRLGPPDVTVSGAEHLQAAGAGHRGVIVLTGHVGNWELGAVLLRRMGFPVSAVALTHGHAPTDRLFNRQRERGGVEVIPLGRGAERACMRALHAGHLLGLVGDRTYTDRGLEVSLFGRRLSLPSGPAILAARSGAPVVPVFLVREGVWAFTLRVGAPLWAASTGKEDAIIDLMQSYAAVLEDVVRRTPSQWLMFQPAGEAGRPMAGLAG